ncbi:MAG: DUF3048 domain-containing protein [Lachnospiraceae bacterium]|nr:DUF3048 domain-containing protein [Lachnospiraceae bacterium]
MRNIQKQRALALVLVLIILSSLCLSACGKAKDNGSDSPTPTEETVATATPTISPTSTPSPEPTASPTPTVTPIPEGMMRSDITNEWVKEEIAKARPIAVMLNNKEEAVPQSGISRAGLVYEAPTEVDIQRLLAIIEDYSDLEKIGSVRSSRHYYIDWMLEWDAIYCHFGGSVYANNILKRSDIHNLDGMALDGTTYYRTKDRVAPHNAYTAGDRIIKEAERRKYPLTHTDKYVSGHFKFADEENPNLLEGGFDATYASPGYPLNKPWFEYNAEEGVYYRFQYGDKHIDEMNGEQLSYTNIIFQYCKWKGMGDGTSRIDITTIDSGRKGYYITMGKAIPITWSKTSEREPTRYFDMDGNEIKLNTGKTWICIIKDTYADQTDIH